MLSVQGQSRAISLLQRSIAAGRLGHTWLFAGPLGVGKFKLAVELARTHLCDRPIRQRNEATLPQLPPDFLLTLPCGECESCRAIESGAVGGGGNHPDLHIITKELIRFHDKSGKSKGTTLGIDVIRGEITGDPGQNKEAKIAKRSFRGRGKFFIIDEADLMEAPAQNALLKTLEEPPAESYVILITTSPQELLSTIRSRSQLLSFNELPEEVVMSSLMARGLEGEDAQLMARLARGSLGRAARWLDDIDEIDRGISKAADRKAAAAERGEPADEEEDAGGGVDTKFTPGGILSWTREIAAQLDQLVAGRAAASDVAGAIAKFALEYSGLQLKRDRFASADQAKRNGIGLMMTIVAEWFADRLRHGIGAPYPTLLPGITGALDPEVVPQLIASARAAEAQIDMNANDKILLAATATRWAQLLQESR